jgi:hypothetical protein
VIGNSGYVDIGVFIRAINESQVSGPEVGSIQRLSSASSRWQRDDMAHFTTADGDASDS